MISPLGQRQMFQTANLEAVRFVHEMISQAQREASQKQAVEDKLAEAQNSVREVPGADQIRTEDRRGRGGQTGQPASGAWEEDASGDSESSVEEEGIGGNTAGSAEIHLDLLA